MPQNNLIHEKSPYLLQHAHNPVNWYPWGDEAFRKAQTEQKPVFLSIGYSTCHWCHVMERESFEDDEAAAALNRDFVAVKVDREERPDVDAIYMAVCQAMTGAGGWPLTVLTTPEQKPFWAGTYLPKHTRRGQPGLLELLDAAARLWREDRARLLQSGDEIADHIAKRQDAPGAVPEKGLLSTAAELFCRSFDPQNGGFGSAPKFPTPHNLLFLMEYARLEGDGNAMHMAETTLTQMARGGLFDQIGGGFSRYSTDARWLAPHFEKMLYDNALLAYAYLEAYQRTGNAFFHKVARRTLDYILRELTNSEGGFLCGQDADSDGAEGKYYLFTPQEIAAVLGREAGADFCRTYDVTAQGNFEGSSIPNLLSNPNYQNAYCERTSACEALREYRLTRTALHRDDKCLTSWNALALAAFAKAYRVLEETRYLDAAKRGRDFICAKLTAPDGRLYVRWREGEARHTGQLDDYAFLAWALLELYAADYDVSQLQDAARLMDRAYSLFWDEENAGFYLTAADAQRLIARPKELYDGALPSGNSMAALAAVRLAGLTGESRWRSLADRQLAYLAGNIQSYPAGYSAALLALEEALSPTRELVCALRRKPPEKLRQLCEAHRLYALCKTPENAAALAEAAPFTAAYPVPEQGEAYYLCQGGACQKPVNTPDELGLGASGLFGSSQSPPCSDIVNIS